MGYAGGGARSVSPPKAEQRLRDVAGGGDAPRLQVPAAAPRTQAPVPGTSAPAASAALWPLRGLELRRGGVRGELASEGDHRCLALAARVSCPVSPVPTSNPCDSQCPPGRHQTLFRSEPPYVASSAHSSCRGTRTLQVLTCPCPPSTHQCLPLLTTASQCPSISQFPLLHPRAF